MALVPKLVITFSPLTILYISHPIWYHSILLIIVFEVLSETTGASSDIYC